MLLICPIIVLLATIYSSWFESVIVSAEGRVEHQKRNQTATSQWPFSFVFGVQLDYSSPLKSASSTDEIRVISPCVCRKGVEHQKLNQVKAVADLVPPG